MTKVDPLANLRDIHLPKPISWWPLAPGWYVLALLILLMIALSLYLIYRNYNYHRPRREALQLLTIYQAHYLRDNNCQLTSSKLSALLKRTALAYYPRQEVAGLDADEWLNFLNKTAKDVDFFSVRQCLLDLPYQKSNETVDLYPLFKLAKVWIKQQGKSCSS